MSLDRGVLARLDRRLLAGLGHDETYHMIRVPVTAAKWSTWKRYCGAAGIAMGRAIVALIDREMASVLGESAGENYSVLAERVREELASRAARVAGREQAAAAAEERLRSRSEHLRRWEGELEVREHRLELALKLATQRRDATASEV